MYKKLTIATVVAAVVGICPSGAMAQTWSFPGLSNPAFAAITPGGPAPRRDLTGEPHGVLQAQVGVALLVEGTLEEEVGPGLDVIQVVGGEQLVVRPLRDHAAFVQHEDARGVANRGEAVGDHDRRAAVTQPAQAIEHRFFRDGVDGEDELEPSLGQVRLHRRAEGPLLPRHAGGLGQGSHRFGQRHPRPSGEGPVEIVVRGPPQGSRHRQGGTTHGPASGPLLPAALDEHEPPVNAHPEEVDRRHRADTEVGGHGERPRPGAGQEPGRLGEQRLQGGLFQLARNRKERLATKVDPEGADAERDDSRRQCIEQAQVDDGAEKGDDQHLLWDHERGEDDDEDGIAPAEAHARQRKCRQ